MAGNWIMLSRKITEWEWHKDKNVMLLWIHLLAMAEYKDNEVSGMLVKRGQLYTSLAELSGISGLSLQEVRTSLKKLIATGSLTSESTSGATRQGRIITISKYECYQGDTEGEQQALQQAEQQADQQASKEQRKEAKENRILTNNLNNIISHTQRVRTCEDYDEEARNNTCWCDTMCMNYHMKRTVLFQLLDKFLQKNKEEMKEHENFQDYVSHFRNAFVSGQLAKTPPKEEPKITQAPIAPLIKSKEEIEREKQDRLEYDRQRWLGIIEYAKTHPKSSAKQQLDIAIQSGTLDKLGIKYN